MLNARASMSSSAEANCAGDLHRLHVGEATSTNFGEREVFGWHHTARRISGEERICADFIVVWTSVVERWTFGVVGKQHYVANVRRAIATVINRSHLFTQFEFDPEGCWKKRLAGLRAQHGHKGRG